MVTLLTIVALLLFLYIEWRIYKPLDDSGEEKVFTVEQGQGVKEIAQRLEREGFVKDAWYFVVYVYWKRNEERLQVGDFEISPAMNIPEVAHVLSGKAGSQEMEITIVEGWNRKDIDAYLVKQGLIQEGEFLKATKNFEESLYGGYYDLPFGASLEGFLFPDTYRVYKDAQVDAVLEKMLVNFQNKVDSLIPEIEEQGKTLYDVLIMASIVERESASREEMPAISGVFYNRLDANLLLESDATVNFVTGENKRQPTLKDTKTDSPYNTYLYRGLPPGPICNPSLAAIKAAIHPEDTDYLYFLHPEEGGTIFSKTSEEHGRNKERYLE